MIDKKYFDPCYMYPNYFNSNPMTLAIALGFTVTLIKGVSFFHLSLILLSTFPLNSRILWHCLGGEVVVTKSKQWRAVMTSLIAKFKSKNGKLVTYRIPFDKQKMPFDRVSSNVDSRMINCLKNSELKLVRIFAS